MPASVQSSARAWWRLPRPGARAPRRSATRGSTRRSPPSMRSSSATRAWSGSASSSPAPSSSRARTGSRAGISRACSPATRPRRWSPTSSGSFASCERAASGRPTSGRRWSRTATSTRPPPNARSGSTRRSGVFPSRATRTRCPNPVSACRCGAAANTSTRFARAGGFAPGRTRCVGSTAAGTSTG